MKFMIAIIMMFTPPSYDDDKVLVVEQYANAPLVFDSFYDCSHYVYSNLPVLYDFAIESYSPLDSEVKDIVCFAVPPGTAV